jgi:MYXO-CTERM domain-containing protein
VNMRRCGLALAAGAGALLAAAIPTSAAVIDAPPPTVCSGNAGVLATPQDMNNSGQPFLTKALQSVANGTGSTTYTYLLTSFRPSTATFSELLDCAFSTATGTPTLATYGTQQNNPTFVLSNNGSNWQLTITLTVNANDPVCDRVQLKGTDGANTFTDHSNLVGAPGGTLCSSAVTPEVPKAGLLLVAGGGAVAAILFFQRRRRRQTA